MPSTFKIAPEDQDRLDHFFDHPSAGLSQEVALARALAEKAAARGQGSLAGTLLKITGRLSRDDIMLREQEHSLLGKDAVVDFAKALIQVVIGEVDSLCVTDQTANLFLDRVVKRVIEAVSPEARALPAQQHLLMVVDRPAKIIDAKCD